MATNKKQNASVIKMSALSSTNMLNLRDAWLHVREEIARARAQAGRDSEEITLVAVSKGQDFAKIKTLYDLGQRHFGESYAQEFHEKYQRARDENLDVIWHFIGAVQSNKIKLIKDAHAVETISSFRHAQILNNAATKIIDVFVQINLAHNLDQQGVAPEAAATLIKELSTLKNLNLRGLMCIAPLNSKEPTKFWFAKMSELKQEIIANGIIDRLELSMGMSDDFVDAIACGTNLVRVGTKIFGARNY